VPISIRYSDLLPKWGSDVDVQIGKPLQVKNYDLTHTKASAKQLTDDLEQALKQLNPDTRS